MSEQHNLFVEWSNLRESVARARRDLQAAKEMKHPALIASMETQLRAAGLAYEIVVGKLDA
jgi:hypothetical protein